MAEASPEVAVSEPSPPAKFRFDTGVFQMKPDRPRTRRQRLLRAAVIPKDSTDQTTAMVALSLTGLPTKSVFYVCTKDVGGNQLVRVGENRHKRLSIGGDAAKQSNNGSGRRSDAFSGRYEEPPLALNCDGAAGEDLQAVDTAGNVLITVGAATKPQVLIRVNRFSSAMRRDVQAFRQLKSSALVNSRDVVN